MLLCILFRILLMRFVFQALVIKKEFREKCQRSLHSMVELYRICFICLFVFSHFFYSYYTEVLSKFYFSAKYL